MVLIWWNGFWVPKLMSISTAWLAFPVWSPERSHLTSLRYSLNPHLTDDKSGVWARMIKFLHFPWKEIAAGWAGRVSFTCVYNSDLAGSGLARRWVIWGPDPNTLLYIKYSNLGIPAPPGPGMPASMQTPDHGIYIELSPTDFFTSRLYNSILAAGWIMTQSQGTNTWRGWLSGKR